MQGRRNDESRVKLPESALRVIMRRLRAIMAEPADGQARLDKIVHQIAGLMVAEVCSIYLKRQDGSLELFATEGLNAGAVHTTRLNRGEGLVGRCAELAEPVNEPEAQNHPAFSYRPETGEEIYHSLLAVPVLRAGLVLGVLVVQNRTPKIYTEEDVEVLETTAMVIAEHIVSGAVSGMAATVEANRTAPVVVHGSPLSDGIALGHVVLHQPRVVVTKLIADDPDAELIRLETAVGTLRETLDEMLSHEGLSRVGEHRDVLEAYRMFANDRGWLRRMREGVTEGLTAEAAVERVQNSTRARMLRQGDPFWRERQRDLDDLSDRLLRILAGKTSGTAAESELPSDTILVARAMGPAELLDYDRAKLRGLVVEDGSSQSHVAIVAKALGIAAIGQAKGLIERVNMGDAVIIDAESGQVHLRPSADVIHAYSDKVRFRARRQHKYSALRDVEPLTKDGVRISLNMNAGLLVDMPHLIEAGADGVGLFRTELQFMLASKLPRLERQTEVYRSVIEQALGRPIVFRALDIGGDKVLPYLRRYGEENPALGWRAIRMSLDRPALFRTQIRALLRSVGEGELRLMVPMVSTPDEMDAARTLINKELDLAAKRGLVPSRLLIGAMLEVPSLLHDLDNLMRRVDFVSVGSNDLMQFMFAADRGNPRVSGRYDSLSAAGLRALSAIVEAAKRHNVPLNLCGEMAGRPLEAMALIGIGFRSISMAPASIGPVKTMILSLDCDKLTEYMQDRLAGTTGSLRTDLIAFAEANSIEL